MEQEKIKELLSKFYEGTSSEEEEARLKDYLADPAVASLFPEAEYVAAFRTVVPEPSADFLNKLEAVTHRDRKMTSREEIDTLQHDHRRYGSNIDRYVSPV